MPKSCKLCASKRYANTFWCFKHYREWVDMGKQCLHQFFLAESTYRLPEDAPALGSLIREELKKIKKGWFGHSQWDFIQASLSAENRLKKLEIKVIKYQCALCGEVRKHDLP